MYVLFTQYKYDRCDKIGLSRYMMVECKDRHIGMFDLENKLQEVFPDLRINFAGTIFSSIEQELLETMIGMNNREYFLHYLDGGFKWVGKLDK